MLRGLPTSKSILPLLVGCAAIVLPARADRPSQAQVEYRLVLDRGHPWRPPFGLDRVGAPPAVVVRASDRPAGGTFVLAIHQKGREIGRRSVRFPERPSYSARVPIPEEADEVVLLDPSDKDNERARAKIDLPASRPTRSPGPTRS